MLFLPVYLHTHNLAAHEDETIEYIIFKIHFTRFESILVSIMEAFYLDRDENINV